jgi:hypothetical protein
MSQNAIFTMACPYGKAGEPPAIGRRDSPVVGATETVQTHMNTKGICGQCPSDQLTPEAAKTLPAVFIGLSACLRPVGALRFQRLQEGLKDGITLAFFLPFFFAVDHWQQERDGWVHVEILLQAAVREVAP